MPCRKETGCPTGCPTHGSAVKRCWRLCGPIPIPTRPWRAHTGSTGGSRTTYDTGLAAIAAAEEVQRQMQARAARIWEVQAEEVAYRDGVFTCTQHPEARMTFKEPARQLNRTGGPITCSMSTNSTGVGSTFAGNIVDVEVDPETGKVQILRYTAIIDAGQAVHPSYVEGQVQGSTVQGIGWALNEEYVYTA